jgi:hypothetical protein
MKKTIDSVSEFRDEFHRMGRGSQFSYDGLAVLFEHIEDYEQDTGEEWELDVIALCCEFTEYSSALEACEGYSFEPDEEQDEEEQQESALEWLEGETMVLRVHPSGVIIQNF